MRKLLTAWLLVVVLAAVVAAAAFAATSPSPNMPVVDPGQGCQYGSSWYPPGYYSNPWPGHAVHPTANGGPYYNPDNPVLAGGSVLQIWWWCGTSRPAYLLSAGYHWFMGCDSAGMGVNNPGDGGAYTWSGYNIYCPHI